MTDRLTLTRAFEGAGIASDVAERIATEIYDAIHDNVATKADIAELRADLAHTINTMVARLVVVIVIALGVLFAALQHWPPH